MSTREELQPAEQRFAHLLAEAEAGTRFPTTTERARLSHEQVMKLQRVEREVLDGMAPQQRRLRSQRGELSAHQNGVWLANYPHEVPMVNGIPPWIAATLCDIVDEGRG